MTPRQNKKQRCCAEYRQEHLPEEHALEQSGNAGERQDEKNEEEPHGEGQELITEKEYTRAKKYYMKLTGADIVLAH